MSDDDTEDGVEVAEEPVYPTCFAGGSLNLQVIPVRLGRHWWHSKAGERYYKVTTLAPNRELVRVFLLHGLSDADRNLLLEGAVELMTAKRPRVL